MFSIVRRKSICLWFYTSETYISQQLEMTNQCHILAVQRTPLSQLCTIYWRMSGRLNCSKLLVQSWLWYSQQHSWVLWHYINWLPHHLDKSPLQTENLVNLGCSYVSIVVLWQFWQYFVFKELSSGLQLGFILNLKYALSSQGSHSLIKLHSSSQYIYIFSDWISLKGRFLPHQLHKRN